MDIVKNIISNFKNLPFTTKRLLGIGLTFAFVLALPLFVWGILTQRFDVREKAEDISVICETAGGTWDPTQYTCEGESVTRTWCEENIGAFREGCTQPPNPTCRTLCQFTAPTCVAENKVINVTPEGGAGTCHDLQTAINTVSGPDFVINMAAGTYDIPNSGIHINGKSNLIINGDSILGSKSVTLNFNGNNWGFEIRNSSGSVNYLNITGHVSNGMFSINNSQNFSLGYSHVYSTSSHTLDIHGSTNISVYNTEIQSSAGGIEVGSSNIVSLSNNVIHNTANAIAVYDSSTVNITSNLVYGNRESGLSISNIQGLTVNANTFTNNTYDHPTMATIYIRGTQGTNYNFSKNIVSVSLGAGIESESGQEISAESNHNDVYANNPNYKNHTNHTGLNGNISQDPLLNSNNFEYCPMPWSPVIYGNIANFEYMGYKPPCANVTPSPSPTASPTEEPTVSPTSTSTSTPNSLAGDVNLDGIVNVADLQLIIAHYDEINPSYTDMDLDQNNDGVVNIVDLGIVISNYY